MAKAVEHTPYKIYDRTGNLVMESDERCRYAPSTELSLIDAGHKIMLGGERITKKKVQELLKGGKP